MKKILLVLTISLTSITSFSQKKTKIKGNKEVITTIHNLEKEFNTIKIDEELEVNLRQGLKNNYVLTTDRNLQEVITFSIQDSTLHISTTHRIAKSKKLDISLEFVKLNKIILLNDAEVKGEGTFKAKEFQINSYNSGKFDLDITAENVTVNMSQKSEGKIKIKSDNSTLNLHDKSDLEASLIAKKSIIKLTNSSDLELSGDTEEIDVTLKDSSEIDAENLKTSVVSLLALDKADAKIYAGKNFSLHAEGKTNVYLYGDPEIEIKSFKDSAKLQKK